MIRLEDLDVASEFRALVEISPPAPTQLDEDGIKERRRQKLMKSLYDGRVRQREERAKEKAEAEEEARLEALERESNFEGWSSRWRQEHEVTESEPYVRYVTRG